jgi:hypothetical protein
MKKMSFVRNVALAALAFSAVSSTATPSADARPNCRAASFKAAKVAGDGVELARICQDPVEPEPEPEPRPRPRPFPTDPPLVLDPGPSTDCSMYDNVDHYITDAENTHGQEGYENDRFGFCNESTKKAYHDAALQCEKQIADWVCQVITAAEVADPVHYDSVARRCRNVDKSVCRVGAGGEAGDHRSTHIESGACYVTAASADVPYDDIRCCCGCFPGEVEVLSTHGYVPMNALEAMTSKSIRLATPRGADSEDFKVSGALRKGDLVQGPEEKPVIVITTDNGASLTLTDLHPVLTVSDEAIDMKQARELKVGDVLFTDSGEATEITDLTTHVLPADANTVYNVFVPGAVHGDDHVIVANELRTGDRAWQDALSARSSFEYGLERAAAE